VGASLIIGLIAGVLVVLAVIGFDKIRIDDPVGATSVHLVNGVFGTLCVGLFAEPTRVAARCLAPANNWKGLFYGGGLDQLLGQAVGVGATAIYVLAISGASWLIIKYTIGLRVSAQEEMDGLDIGEHGVYAYPAALVTESFGFGKPVATFQSDPSVVAEPTVSAAS
jgi:Amt family ammonium transporter